MQATNRLDGTRRALWIALGSLCVALGTIGIFVPGLPTTVFLLLASWFFSRGSERMNRWLHRHSRLGRYLEIARTGGMPRRARVISLAGIWGGIGMALAGPAGHSAALAAALVLAGVTGSGFVLLIGRRGNSALATA